jgi:hypothetical protein
LEKSNQQDSIKFWEEKERKIGEEIIGKDMSEYMGGHPDLTGQKWGILYYTINAFYFQAFPKKNWITSLLGKVEDKIDDSVNLRLLWINVRRVYLPERKNTFLSFLLPPDYRIFVDYRINNSDYTLIFTLSSKESKNRFIDCYNQSKKGTR